MGKLNVRAFRVEFTLLFLWLGAFKLGENEMHSRKLFVLFVAIALVVACGGGGSSPSSGNISTPSTPVNTGSNTGTEEGAPTKYNLDALGVPKFVNTNYIDLSKTTQISRFRSSAGHDYSDDIESCRSMKHYFAVPDATTAIVSPVTGTITRILPEWAGSQIQIQSDAQPSFTFILFHVATASTFTIGEKVTEGQSLGTHIGTQTSSDIAVEVDATDGRRFVSYFDVLNDTAFAPYIARGITSRSQLIIAKSERDAAPLTCTGEAFTHASNDPLTTWVVY